ncbi:hypothetical protein BDR04DRAFT_504077 [Suillus decipiens]|nr:hypothetical protein BDR04DRAFT_504077 [Suillus decipiens]
MKLQWGGKFAVVLSEVSGTRAGQLLFKLKFAVAVPLNYRSTKLQLHTTHLSETNGKTLHFNLASSSTTLGAHWQVQVTT